MMRTERRLGEKDGDGRREVEVRCAGLLRNLEVADGVELRRKG